MHQNNKILVSLVGIVVIIGVLLFVFIYLDTDSPKTTKKDTTKTEEKNKKDEDNEDDKKKDDELDLLTNKEKEELDIRKEYKVKAVERGEDGNVLLYKIIDSPPDADSDGLFDYEEEEFGTNKNKADTDGDGMMDRTEIKQGTDPTKKNNFTK